MVDLQGSSAPPAVLPVVANSSFLAHPFVFFSPPCIYQSPPHLLLHSAASLCAPVIDRWPLSAHVRAGGGVFIDGAMSRRGCRKMNCRLRGVLTDFQRELPGEQMQILNETRFPCSACSVSQSAPLLQFHSSSSREEVL